MLLVEEVDMMDTDHFTGRRVAGGLQSRGALVKDVQNDTSALSLSLYPPQ